MSQDSTAPIIVSKKAKQEAAANVYSLPSIPQAIKYLHAAVGFPAKDTWVKAIKSGNYGSWPGLNVDVVNKHFLEAIETQKGHMKKQCQNIRSTKQKVIVEEMDKDVELTHTSAKHIPFWSKFLMHTTRCTLIRQNAYQCNPTKAISSSWFITMLMQITSILNKCTTMLTHR